MRHIPYAVGLFMATPLILWALLWGFAFPGPKSGFDSPGAVALLIVSVPLVVYFLIVNLGMLANSMSGHAVVERPVGRIAGRLVHWLPVATLAAGAASAGMLAATGAATAEAAAVAVVALAVAAVLHRAVRRRSAGTVDGRVRDVPPAAAATSGPAGAVASVAASPAAAQKDGPLPWLLVNAVLLVALAVLQFGLPALLVAALLAVPVVFGALIWLTWWGCEAPRGT